jgi:spermidine synthase
MADKSKEQYFLERLNDGMGFWVKSKARLAHAKSPFQDIEVLETDFGRTLRIDDYFMTSDKDEFFYHENMIHPAGIAHYAPKRALVIGGGDGGAAEEYLKYSSMEEVVMVEIDRVVVDFCKEHLPLVHRGAFDDSRLKVVIADGKKYVEDCQEQFDLMMLDLTDPFGPSEAFIPSRFFGALSTYFRPRGRIIDAPGVPHHAAQCLPSRLQLVKNGF